MNHKMETHRNLGMGVLSVAGTGSSSPAMVWMWHESKEGRLRGSKDKRRVGERGWGVGREEGKRNEGQAGGCLGCLSPPCDSPRLPLLRAPLLHPLHRSLIGWIQEWCVLCHTLLRSVLTRLQIATSYSTTESHRKLRLWVNPGGRGSHRTEFRGLYEAAGNASPVRIAHHSDPGVPE